LTGRRRATGVTIGPIRNRSVDAATAASTIHGSATAVTGARHHSWSQTNIPSHPASSAAAASRAIVSGSDSSSNSGTQTAKRIIGSRCDR
jgi:hypothetical protein